MGADFLRALLSALRRQGRPQRLVVAAPHVRPTRVLLTGAGGGVAAMLRPALAPTLDELRLCDQVQVQPEAASERFVQARLEDLDALRAAARGVDAIVHLGAVAKEASFERLLDVNVRGSIHVLEAARLENISRVLLASSMHVVGFYGRDTRLSEDDPIRPDSRYGASKACMEAFGRLYADKYGIDVACLRIGHVTASRRDAEPGLWIAPAELAALVQTALGHPGFGFCVVHAVSDRRGARLRTGPLCWPLGRYARPASAPAMPKARTPREAYPTDPVARRLRGGGFASSDQDMC